MSHQEESTAVNNYFHFLANISCRVQYQIHDISGILFHKNDLQTLIKYYFDVIVNKSTVLKKYRLKLFSVMKFGIFEGFELVQNSVLLDKLGIKIN